MNLSVQPVPTVVAFPLSEKRSTFFIILQLLLKS